MSLVAGRSEEFGIVGPGKVTSRVADAEHFEARQIPLRATAYRVDAIYGGARGEVGPTATSVMPTSSLTKTMPTDTTKRSKSTKALGLIIF